MKSTSMDAIFVALAHPARRKILDVVKERPGGNVNDVCDYFDISRIAVMKHLQLLEQAELIISQKEGRERKLYFNVVPIQMIYDRWTTEYSAIWAGRLTQIKYRIESVQQRRSERSGTRRESPPRERKRHA